MRYFKQLTLIFATLAVGTLVFAGNHGGGGGFCYSGEWYSHKYDTCFNKRGRCKQYNGTDKKTCNTPKDRLRCDWDRHNKTCYPEDGYNQCPHGYWYSVKYNKCFKKRGRCRQYNGTDYNTCNTPKDRMRCDWDRHSQRCYPE